MEGYTGDTYCKNCGILVQKGKVIPALPDPHEGYTCYVLDGKEVWLPTGVDPREYTMHKYSQEMEHPYWEIEQEILRLCNQARAAEGLSELAWYEDAYSYSHVRAVECLELFEHTRPNGKSWDSVYVDAGVVFYNDTWGENLAKMVGYDARQLAQCMFDAWMNSPGHRANIMRQAFQEVAIVVIYENNTWIGVQNFFGHPNRG